MIQKVSATPKTAPVNAQNKKQSKKPKEPLLNDTQKSYMDSFVRNSKETAPILLGLTALWSLLDYGSGKVSMAKSIKNNLAFFFAPILIVSSSIIAGIENKKTSKSSKA